MPVRLTGTQAASHRSPPAPRSPYTLQSLPALPDAAGVVIPACILARIVRARPLAGRVHSARDLSRAVPVVVGALLGRDGDDAEQLGLHGASKQRAQPAAPTQPACASWKAIPYNPVTRARRSGREGPPTCSCGQLWTMCW